MNASAAIHPDVSVRKKPALWPLLAVPVGVALWIVLRNPALGLSVAALGGTVFLPLNLKMEGRRAKAVMLLWFLAALTAVVLAALGNPSFTPSTVWFLIGLASIFDSYRSKRR